LTAFLLYKNGVIHEGEVMDAHSLPKVAKPMHRASGESPGAHTVTG
jgi:hypothetical protein